MIHFTNIHRAGLLPEMLSARDPRPAVEQLHENYAHGGGWRDFKGHTLGGDADVGYHLTYPEDPPMREISRAQLRDETVVLFEGDWVAVIQPDGSHRIARMD